MSRITALIIAVVACLLVALGFSAYYYHDEAGKAQKDLETTTHNLELSNGTIAVMSVRQTALAALDAKHTKELADAKTNIDQLERDVATGRVWLQVAARCNNVRQSTGTARVDDGTGPRLADTAERDYFTLRKRIETSREMISGLQEYIQTQCYKNPTR